MTIDHDRLIEYVMGALTPEEEKDIATHLNEHPDDAAFVRDLFENMAEIALELEPIPLADNAEESLLSRIRLAGTEEAHQEKAEELTVMVPEKEDKASRQADQKADHYKIDDDFFERTSQIPHADIAGRGQKKIIQDKPAGLPRWLTGLAAAAAIATFVYLGFRPQSDPIIVQLDRLCAEEGTVCDVLSNDANEGVGEFARRPNNALYVVLNEPPPEGKVYQAWEIVDGTPQSVGLGEGRLLNVSKALGENSIFGVSLEPEGGSESPTDVIAILPLSS